jgi:hypothetical protein
MMGDHYSVDKEPEKPAIDVKTLLNRHLTAVRKALKGTRYRLERDTQGFYMVSDVHPFEHLRKLRLVWLGRDLAIKYDDETFIKIYREVP